MLHLAFVGNGPGRDRIGVIDRSGAARGDYLLSRRLDVTALVGRAALQDRRQAQRSTRGRARDASRRQTSGQNRGKLLAPRYDRLRLCAAGNAI